MKSTYSRRYRRSSTSARELTMFKKNSLQDQTFFGAPVHDNFFKPNLSIQRKCEHCEAEQKNVSRKADSKEDEKMVHKMEEKKEDKTLHRAEEKELHKAEDKELSRTEEKELHKKEDKELHRVEDKELHKAEDKKEETLHRATEPEKKIDKKENGASGGSAATTASYVQSLSGKGSALPGDTLQFFKQRMGYDFSHVKIHTGVDAEKSAAEVNAKAYAVDHHIVFSKDRYNPASADGKKLLAHELTHVVQQQGKDAEIINRVSELNDKKKEEKPVSFEGSASKTHQKTGHGCADVNVQGQTDANYKSSFRVSGRSHGSEECTDCSAPDCITIDGTLVSSFKAHPVITLPSVPDGLTVCEARAVRRFINTTLKRHEQQHVTAFNTYNGTVRTPFSFTGCRAQLDAFVQSMHDNIDVQRVASANALSDALDPFNATIPCNC